MISFVRACVVIGLGGAVAMGCNSAPPSDKAPARETGSKAETEGKMVNTLPSGEPREVSFRTEDGWTIVGDSYAPTGQSKGTVLLLHQRNGSAKDWKPLCIALRQAGYLAFALDQRGAGRSTQGPGLTGEDAPWPTSGDIAGAIKAAGDTGPIGLVGASYGANNALIYAAAHSAQIKGVVLFSPGAEYHGLDALLPARAYRGALAIFHAKQDSISGDGPQQIHDASPASHRSLNLSDGDQHGTALLNEARIQETVQFLQKALQ